VVLYHTDQLITREFFFHFQFKIPLNYFQFSLRF